MCGNQHDSDMSRLNSGKTTEFDTFYYLRKPLVNLTNITNTNISADRGQSQLSNGTRVWGSGTECSHQKNRLPKVAWLVPNVWH